MKGLELYFNKCVKITQSAVRICKKTITQSRLFYI